MFKSGDVLRYTPIGGKRCREGMAYVNEHGIAIDTYWSFGGPGLGTALGLHERCLRGKTWKSRNGQVVGIGEMEFGHAHNLISWLEERANLIKIAADAYWMHEVETHDGGEIAHESLENIENDVIDMDALGYLQSTTLYEELKTRIAEEPTSRA